TGDPSLYIEPANLAHAFLIDCGNSHLGHARLLRVKFLFLSHSHLDHFIGFDSWMRVHLGGEDTLHVIGPAGTADRVFHKIHGYVWNLAETVYLKFAVTELDPLRSFQLLPENRYELEAVNPELPVIDARGDWDFRFAPLQHLTITSCGYRLFTPDRWRVDDEALAASGLKPGPWVKEVKTRTEGTVQIGDKDWSIEELRSRLLVFANGYAISYITDAVFHPENHAKMVELARESDHLFCESSFLKDDADRASRTHHLTTVQAATVARDANVKQLHLFHFSRRYAGAESHFLKEARSIFPNAVIGVK
ncbi:MAG TPA: MBL fold metallo-hydrolase, partial [Acidobacteriota bacterium]|nr:MBL fold metallo-hydrolase [Acidobacteriota bacterium]